MCLFESKIMQMNVLASAVLFLFIGPFDRASSWETDSVILQVNPQQVLIAVTETFVLNCSITTPNHGLLPDQLKWEHNNTWMVNSSHVVDNSTVQLRIHLTCYEDAGVYGCGVFYNSSQFLYVATQNITVVVGEKPKLRKDMLTLVNVSGKPVQELTLQGTGALQINVTYKLFLGRPHHYHFIFNNSTVCMGMLRNKSESFCRIGKDILGQLFTWNDLIDVNSKCNDNFIRCDTLGAKVVAENAFGTSEVILHWNLLSHAQCPPPRHLNVMSGECGVTFSWQRPLLVWEEFPVFYQLTYNGTQVLSGMKLTPTHIYHFEELNYTIKHLEPFSRYTFAVSCKFFDLSGYDSGPSVYTEITSSEEVPSEAPTCEVTNKTIDGHVFVLLKPPQQSTWNGLPRRYVVEYVHRDQHNSVNVSLDGLNVTKPLGVWLNDTEVHKNYSVRVTMCTSAGCRQNSRQPCFIDAVTEDSINEAGVDTPKPERHIGAVLWVSIAMGLTVGIVLCIFIAYSIKRKRSRRRQRSSLRPLFVGLDPNGPRFYENDLVDGPSLCEESQHYDLIPTTRLLKDVDCTVGNCPVTAI